MKTCNDELGLRGKANMHLLDQKTEMLIEADMIFKYQMLSKFGHLYNKCQNLITLKVYNTIIIKLQTWPVQCDYLIIKIIKYGDSLVVYHFVMW